MKSAKGGLSSWINGQDWFADFVGVFGFEAGNNVLETANFVDKLLINSTRAIF